MMTVSKARRPRRNSMQKRLCANGANMPLTVAVPKSSGPVTEAEAVLKSVDRRIKLTASGVPR